MALSGRIYPWQACNYGVESLIQGEGERGKEVKGEEKFNTRK